MKKIKQISIIILSIQILFLSCKKDEIEEVKVQLQPNQELIDIKVILPEMSDIDLSTTEIISLGRSFNVSASGDASIAVTSGNHTLISLQDKENEGVILLSYISDSNKEISISSTIQSSLYIGLGTFMNFEELKNFFFENYTENNEIIGLEDEVTSRFLNDENFIEHADFSSLVEETVSNLISSDKIIDIGGKGVIVDSKEKSKIKVVNSGRDAIGFQSRSRRRTHAFIYKMSHKNKGEDKSIIDLLDISGSVEATKDTIVESTSGFTSTFGTIWDAASGKGLEVGIKDTPPVNLPLLENEQEARYQVRIIGPHCQELKLSELTNAEQSKMQEMLLNTFAFDMILPVLGTAIGFKNFDVDQVKAELFRDALVAAMGSSTLELVLNGEFAEASKAFFLEFNLGINSGTLDSGLQKLVNTLIDLFDFDIVENTKIETVFAPLKIIDALLQANDVFGRILVDICTSNPIEEWEVLISDSNDLSCLVDKPIINIGENAIIEAKVQDLQLFSGQEIEYRWEVLGIEYGRVKLNSTDLAALLITTHGDENKVFFTPTVEEEALFLGDFEQEINVKAFIKEDGNSRQIGECSTIIKITRKKWKIRPEGIIVSGGNSVVLRVVDEKNEAINPPEGNQLSIEWNTTGNHGVFSAASLIENTFGSNEITYDCLDYDVEESLEQVTAKIYYLSENGKELKDDLETYINIKNEENVKYLYVPVEYQMWDGSGGYGYHVIFQFSPQANAKHYYLKVKELKFGNNSTSFVNQGDDWASGNDSDLVNGKYQYITYTGSGPDSARGDALRELGTLQGYAEVKVILEP